MAKMTTYERALQIYQVLIAAAHNRQVLDYQIVGSMIGVPARGLGPHLEHVLHFCKAGRLPCMTAIVVQKRFGDPGDGFPSLKDLHRERERVFAHKWFRMKPVSLADLLPR